MKLLVLVDAIPYELVPANNSHLVGHTQARRFHHREDAAGFAQKAIEQNTDAVNQVNQLLGLPRGTQQALVAEHLSEQLYGGRVRAKLGPNGGGLRSTRPPNAKARPKPPGANDTLAGSTWLSHSMRRYIEDMSQTSAGSITNTAPAANLLSGSSQSRDYIVVVEIAGRHLSSKQGIQLACSDKPPIKKYSSNDHKTAHRSLCKFSNLENTPVSLAITVPMKGLSQPMLLPLAEGVSPGARGIDKPVWDNLLIPVKPLQFLNEEQIKQQADLLQQGWLYVFWNGRLWRELAINKHTALSDVDLNFYRKSKQNDRPAQGHWLDAVWVPYLINGQPQTDILLAASPVQWSWATIEKLESSPADLKVKSVSLAALASYQDSQTFDDSAQQSGAITSANAASQAGIKRLSRQQRQKISAAYLPKTSASLTVQLTDQKGKPWSNADVNILLNGNNLQKKTDADGFIMLNVPCDCDKSELDISVSPAIPQQAFTARLNRLEAVDTVAGLQARLNNLGFNAGPVDGIMGRKTKAATRKFQAIHQLMVDGVSGPQTQQKLTERHHA